MASEKDKCYDNGNNASPLDLLRVRERITKRGMINDNKQVTVHLNQNQGEIQQKRGVNLWRNRASQSWGQRGVGNGV